jgi:hypothetical protein
VPERRGDGGARGLGSKRLRGGPRGCLRPALVAAQAVVEPEGREGERPKEAKPKRARAPGRGEIR